MTNASSAKRRSFRRNLVVVVALILVTALIVSWKLVSLNQVVGPATQDLPPQGQAKSGASVSVVPTKWAEPQQADSVTQYGITWTFDSARTVGHFANGDWWVVGPATIASETPSYTDGRNGWEVNPSSNASNGLDDRLEGFNADLVPTLPFIATAGQTIVKAVSTGEDCGVDSGVHRPCLITSAVLTVLESVPPDGGIQSFRPPFFGTQKPMFTTASLRTEILPSFEPVDSPPALEEAARRFERPQIDYISSWQGRYLHPSENYTFVDNPKVTEVSEYGSEIALDTDIVALRLMLDDSVSEKMPALINFVQTGIDYYGMNNAGVTWNPDGGHMLGRKLPAVFAAVMLDDETMKKQISAAPYGAYGDDGHVYYSTNPQTIDAMKPNRPALFGKTCGDGVYEAALSGEGGAAWTVEIPLA